MAAHAEELATELEARLRAWLEAHGQARTNLAAALVIVDRLHTGCPVDREEMFTETNALKGGRAAALRKLWEKHGVRRLLQDGTTTRSSGYWSDLLDRLDWGRSLAQLPKEERKRITANLVQVVTETIKEWTDRKQVQVVCDRAASPLSWIEDILAAARKKSQGRVEQHLVGAKLEVRLPEAEIGRDAAHAGDAQTGRRGDFQTSHAVYHVTAAPSVGVIERCKENIQGGLHPVILVPRSDVGRAKGLAEAQGAHKSISIFAIEDFVAQNVVELADARDNGFFDVLREILTAYNQRIDDAEADKSLRIEVQ
ncbi:MAG TPA: DUF4928 family protein [Anaerolineae bacterium]|nr:DUF4928 family protein [Anaerolineae bacterium]